jgi:hypothetical protein
MTKKRKPVAAKPPRNPHAKALRSGAFKPKVVKARDPEARKPRHRKPLVEVAEEEDRS